MENLEMLSRAKMYLQKLANGFDPISGAELPDDTVLNNIRLSRCFFYVADVLQQVIDSGGSVKRVSKSKLEPFSLSSEDKARVTLSDEPLQISKFCERINERIDTDKMRKLQVTAFGKWLVDKGFLEIEAHGGNRYKKATDMGKGVGIISEWRAYGDREYFSQTYSWDAQQFLLDNLDEIIEISNNKANN